MKVSLISYAIIILALISGCESAEEQKPNILLIMTDDQAYGDLSINGNEWLETPVIDDLARQGVYASHFYVSPGCAPTRASLLTGRYHQRTGVSGVTRGREDMRINETTMADVFKFFGYTTGIFGKWHNGAHYPYHPLGRGFDQFVGFTSGHWSNYFNTTIEKNGQPFKTNGYLTDVLTNEAIHFINQATENGKPFFCYLPYQSPHTPLQVPDKYFDKYKAMGLDDFNASIYGMCENIDDNVGRVLSSLDELGIRENTIVIFLSDNGPLNFRYNCDLKGRKGSVDQGGVRVPFIIDWKGKLNTQSIESPLAHIDILPTLLNLIGQDYPFEKTIDGVSFAGLLKSKKDFPQRYIFSEWSGKKRVVDGHMLMINNELFDVENDPGQSRDISSDYPEKMDAMKTAYKQWYAGLDLKESINKPIPIGYKNYPITELPAHEANLYPPYEFRKDRRHTGIAYHALYGWAHDWIDFWTSTDAYASWDIEVHTSGAYQLEIQYALAPENKDVHLKVELGDQIIEYIVKEGFEHSEFANNDRVKRDQEAPETDWNTISIGQVELNNGVSELKVYSTKIPGDKSIELKSIIVNKL